MAGSATFTIVTSMPTMSTLMQQIARIRFACVTRFAEGAVTLFKLGNRFEDLLCSADMRKSREDRLKGEVLHLR